MTSNDELASIAHSSAFIFTADIIGPTGAATDTDERTVTALVRDVMKAPAGMRGLSCRGSRWFVLRRATPPPSVSARRMTASSADILRTNDLEAGSDVSGTSL
jgi:hypothetical protein